MQKLYLTDTQKLVNSYVESFGQSIAARKLTEKGYRSPEGAQILQAHIFRIMHGSTTCLLAPDQEDQHQEPPIKERPIAAVPKRAKQIAAELFENEELLQQEIAKTAEDLREELEEERLALEEMQRSLPPLVPLIESQPHREARHLERDIKVSGIFSPRAPLELDEDRYFFGIPCLRHKPVTTTRPYQQRRYGRNSLSSRDLSIHQK